MTGGRGRPRKTAAVQKYPTLKEGEFFTSTSLKNSIKVRCPVCPGPKGKLVEMSGMGAHVTQVHFIDDLSQWEKWYGSLETHIEQKIYHQCALCDTPTFFMVDLIHLSIHMKKHEVTPKQYIERYMGADSSLKIVKDTTLEKSANSPKVDEDKTSQLPITPKPAENIIIPRSVTLKMVSPTSATTSASNLIAQTPSKNGPTIALNPMTPPFSPAASTPSVTSTNISTPSFKSPTSTSVFMSPSTSPGTVKLSIRGKTLKKEKIEAVVPVKRYNSASAQTTEVKKKRLTEEPISQEFDENKSPSLLDKVKKASKGEGSYTTEELLAAVDLCLSPI